MKKLSLLPFFLLLFSCSGTPGKTSITKTDTTTALDSIITKAEESKKEREEKLAEITFDSALAAHDQLQDYFRFVIHGKFIVLQLDADSLLATGEPQLAGTEIFPVAATKDLRMEKLPDSIKSFAGKKFRMITSDGKFYVATIKELKYMVAFYEPYGMEEMLNGQGADNLPFSATSVWKDGMNDKGMIVGEIDTVFSKQDQILAAAPFENPAPVIYKSSNNAHIQAQAKEEIQLTSQFTQIRENYLKVYPEEEKSGSWLDGSEERFYYCLVDGKTAFYTQTLTAGDYCGSPFYAELTSAWQIRTGVKEKLLFCFPGFMHTQMIMDLEGDGIPEFFAWDISGFPLLYKKVNDRWTCVAHMSFMDWRCPC